MSFVEDRQEHWQTTRPTIKERSKFMFSFFESNSGTTVERGQFPEFLFTAK